MVSQTPNPFAIRTVTMPVHLNPFQPLEGMEDMDHVDTIKAWLQTLKARGNFKIKPLEKSLVGLGLSKQVEFLEKLEFWDRNDYRWWDANRSSALDFMPQRDERWRREQMTDFAAGQATELRQHLVEERGWCPSTVNVILDAIHLPGLHFASLALTDDPSGSCKRKRDMADHTASFHQDCTPMECFETKYNEEPSAHVLPRCACSSFKTLVKRFVPNLDEMIRDGEIPIFSFSTLPGGIELKTVTKSTEYITISYVWSQFHPMTPCRIRRLLDTVQPEFSASPKKQVRNFWLDTLCVPQDVEYKDSRRQAIDSIPEVYGRSRIVLVLDDLLLQAESHESSTILGIRILACEWMRRVWTLQEAARATLKPRRLVFCVGDGYKVFDDILRDLENERWQLSAMVLEALKARLVFGTGSEPGMQSPAVFDRLLTTLTYRGCTYAEDEAPCIAAILRSTLGTDTSKQLEKIPWYLREDEKQVTQTQAEFERFVAGTRMTQLFLRLRQFPLSLLFCEGLRVNEAPFRWLPYSFIARSTQLRSRIERKGATQQAMGICDNRGVAFRAVADVFSLDMDDDIDFTKVHLYVCVRGPDHRMRRSYYRQRRIEQSHWDKKLTDENLLPEDQGWANLRKVRRTDHLALITSDADRKAGIVLRIKDISDLDKEDLRTEFLCRVFVGEETERDRIALSARGESFLADQHIYDANPDSTIDYQALNLMAEGLELERAEETPERGPRLNWGYNGEWQGNQIFKGAFSGITARSAYRTTPCCWRICG